MNYEKDTLANGLRVITAPMPRLKSATAMVVVRAGSRGEKKERQGVAHFVEHMMFKGTKKRPTPLAVASELDGVGAVSNAFTGNEMIGFYVQAASKYLPLALDVLSDIFLNSKFAKEELERERGVILEERRMYRDDPRDHIHDLYSRLVFGNHPLGWEVIGREETIKAMRRAHLLDYLARWFRPENTAIVIAGDVDRQEAVAEVRRLFGGLKVANLPETVPFKFKQKKPQVSIEERRTDQTHLALGVPGYSLTHPRRYAVAVLNAILGEGMSSRLFIEIREKRGLAYYIGSVAASYTDAGTLVAFGGVNNRRVAEAISAIVGELRGLREKTVPEKELRKAKEMIKGGLALELESSSFVARFLIGRELLEGKIETPEELMKKLDAVTADEVQEAARDLFVSEGLNLAIIGPNLREDCLLSLLDLS